MKNIIQLLLSWFAAFSFESSLLGQAAAFTYQGVLQEGGVPVTGVNDLTFTLHNAFIGGTRVGVSNVVSDVTITDGRFTVNLDFGSGAFDGTPRWLQIAVRPGASTGAYTDLVPRQPVLPTPYAIYAGRANASGLIGTIGGDQIAPGAIGADHLSNSVGLWNRSGADIHYGNGNVGIGLDTPVTPLDVAGSGWFRVHGGGLDASAGQGVRVFLDAESSNGNIFAYDYHSGGALPLILQQPGGNVGIGTTTPETKLAVAGAVTATQFIGDGSGLTGLSASQLAGGTLSPAVLGNAWQTGGNVGTTPGTHFLGTRDKQSVEFRVNNERALRLDPASSGLPNLIGGSEVNAVTPGVLGAIIAGGGGGTQPNLITNLAHHAAIGGGKGNVIGGTGFSGTLSVIGGGDRNGLSGQLAVVGGGQFNVAGGNHSVIPGGANNATAAGATFALAAGQRAKANHTGSFVWADSTAADFASVGNNQFLIRASGGVGIGTASPAGSLEVAGGIRARGGPPGGNGSNNNGYAFGSGGDADSGMFSLGDGQLSFFINSTERLRLDATGKVGIGTTDPAAGLHVLGSGFFGNHSGGLPATAGAGVRVFRDTTSGDGNVFAYDYQTGTALDLVLQQPGGNVGIGTTTPSTKLDVAGDITCLAVNLTSDRNAKEAFKPVDVREVLEKVARLPISEWQYRAASDARHIGPMAQDFHEAFALGRDDKHITSVDADGVALAAIQGLNQKLEEKTQEVDALKKSVAALTELVNKLAAQQNGGAK